MIWPDGGQAEIAAVVALAAILSYINAMSDIPPKQPVSGTAAARMQSAAGLPPLPEDGLAPDIDDTAALVSLHHAAAQSGSDSFPVLKAFQEYLESERRRARRRMLAVSALFAGILVVLVAVFLSAGFMVFGYMKTTQEQLWRKLDAQAAPPSVAAPPVSEPTGLLAAELNKLSQALAELKRDNARMRAAEEKLPTPVPVPATPVPVSAAPAPVPSTPAQPAPPAPAAVPAVTVAPRAAAVPAVSVPERRPLEQPAPGTPPPAPPPGYADSSLYLQAPGLDLPVSWRVFVPAE
jgi:cell division protein FtsB